MKRSQTVLYWHAEFRVSNQFKFPCENKKNLSLFIDSNKYVEDALFLYGNNTMGYPNFLEGIFHYFHDKVIPNLLKLMNSPSLNNHKDLDSILEDEERAEAKKRPTTRKMFLMIENTDGSTTKENLF